MSGKYEASDEEFVRELCNARDCNWEVISSNLSFELRHGITQHSPYADFILSVNKNLPEIPFHYMFASVEWRNTSLLFIEDQIGKSPDEQRNILIAAIERYRIAARKKLIDIFQRNWLLRKVDSEQYHHIENRYHRFIDESVPLNSDDVPQDEAPDNLSVYNFLGKHVTETELVKKVLILQELKEQLEQTKSENITEIPEGLAPPSDGAT